MGAEGVLRDVAESVAVVGDFLIEYGRHIGATAVIAVAGKRSLSRQGASERTANNAALGVATAVNGIWEKAGDVAVGAGMDTNGELATFMSTQTSIRDVVGSFLIDAGSLMVERYYDNKEKLGRRGLLSRKRTDT